MQASTLPAAYVTQPHALHMARLPSWGRSSRWVFLGFRLWTATRGPFSPLTVCGVCAQLPHTCLTYPCYYTHCSHSSTTLHWTQALYVYTPTSIHSIVFSSLLYFTPTTLLMNINMIRLILGLEPGELMLITLTWNTLLEAKGIVIIVLIIIVVNFVRIGSKLSAIVVPT